MTNVKGHSFRRGPHPAHAGHCRERLTAMSFYEKYVLPRLIDLAMRNKEATRLRQLIVPQAAGRVLEIGIGSGLNLPFYGPQVKHLFGLEPSPELIGLAGRKTGGAPFPVDFLAAGAEHIPLEDGSVDTVLTTWTLCSIPDAHQALCEARRVLKPDGRLLFLEHGLAQEAGVQRWQRRLTPLWRRVTGGCHLDRSIGELVAAAGFRIEALDTGYAQGPRVMAFIYRGSGVPR